MVHGHINPVVSMFAWSMIVEAIDSILYAGPRLRGYEIPLGMQTIKRIDGHAYFDLTALQWCWYDFVGSMPAQTVATIGGHQPEIPVPPGDPLMGAAGRRRKKTRLKSSGACSGSTVALAACFRNTWLRCVPSPRCRGQR